MGLLTGGRAGGWSWSLRMAEALKTKTAVLQRILVKTDIFGTISKSVLTRCLS